MENEVREFYAFAMQWVVTEGLTLAKGLLAFGLVLLAGVIVARMASRALGLAMEKSRLKPSPLLVRFAVNVTRRGIVLVAFIIGLGNLGIDTGALIAGLGVTGLVLGFALKDTLSNFTAGGMILLYRPFDIGHVVDVGGTVGTVKDLTLVTTVLHTPDNRVIMMPNSKVWGNNITNVSLMTTRRVDLVVGIAYDADIDEATAIFLDIAGQNDKVLTDPAPAVTLNELGESSVDFNVRVWADASEYWAVRNEMLRQVKYRLDAAGIGIPFPQRDVWVHQVDATAPLKERRVAETV
ncbi:MAG: mechanosensitive ion channel [Bradymonadaceae bacterium]|nr:mechanosensitive ion channel [Lujinxingiaceae bacterium]